MKSLPTKETKLLAEEESFEDDPFLVYEASEGTKMDLVTSCEMGDALTAELSNVCDDGNNESEESAKSSLNEVEKKEGLETSGMILLEGDGEEQNDPCEEMNIEANPIQKDSKDDVEMSEGEKTSLETEVPDDMIAASSAYLVQEEQVSNLSELDDKPSTTNDADVENISTLLTSSPLLPKPPAAEYLHLHKSLHPPPPPPLSQAASTTKKTHVKKSSEEGSKLPSDEVDLVRLVRTILSVSDEVAGVVKKLKREAGSYSRQTSSSTPLIEIPEGAASTYMKKMKPLQFGKKVYYNVI